MSQSASQGSSPALWWVVIASVGMALLLLVAGCVENGKPPPPPDDSIPLAASSVEKAQAHVDSAESLVQRAKPQANPTGVALINAASEEHGKADLELVQAKADLAKVQAERNQYASQVKTLADKVATVTTALSQVKSGWGYRLQMFVASVFWAIVIALFLHVALGIAGVFIAGPIGIVLGRIGGFLNPLAWFQWLITHLKSKPCLEQPVAASTV